MGLLLRCSLSLACRTTKLVSESRILQQQWRYLQQFQILLASDITKNENVSLSAPLSSRNGNLRTNSTKFRKNDVKTSRSSIPVNKTVAFNIQEASVDDLTDNKMLIEIPENCQQRQYFDMVVKYLHENQFYEALDVLQVKMLKKDLEPDDYIYTALIGYCGFAGHPNEAFKLYDDMVGRGLAVKSTVYHSLFRSVGRNPSRNGLKQLNNLLKTMEEKCIEPDEKTCWSLLKAFGQCGSVEEGVKVLHFMVKRNMDIPQNCTSHLFRSCIKDKASGFQNVLFLYKKMLEYGISVQLHHFQYLLHCVRECSIGDIDSFINVLKRIGVENADKLSSDKDLEENLPNKSQNLYTKYDIELPIFPRDLPNLLSDHPTLGHITSIKNIKTPQDRLYLLGGLEVVIDNMSKNNIKPDLSILTHLLLCGPDTISTEKSLLDLAEKCDIALNIEFLNKILQHRVRRGQYREAKEVLFLIKDSGLQPNQFTFSILTMICAEIDNANQSLVEMNESSMWALWDFMTDKCIDSEDKTCWSILKELGECKSVEEGIKVLDFMTERNLHLPPTYISHLFLCCIKDKTAGFQNVLILYKKMVKYGLAIHLHHYNYLLHCTRDCSIGDVDSFIRTLEKLGVKNAEKLRSARENASMSSEKYELTLFPRELPNILSDTPTLGYLTSLKNIKTPQDRLFLLGGVDVVIDKMVEHNVNPDLGTLTHLLLCSPDTNSAEKKLLDLAAKFDIALNIEFLNKILLHRVRRREYMEAKEILSILRDRGLQFNQFTFGIVSVMCVGVNDAENLLEEMGKYGMRPETTVAIGFLRNACRKYQMDYVNMVLDLIIRYEIEVNRSLLRITDLFYNNCLQLLEVSVYQF